MTFADYLRRWRQNRKRALCEHEWENSGEVELWLGANDPPYALGERRQPKLCKHCGKGQLVFVGYEFEKNA